MLQNPRRNSGQHQPNTRHQRQTWQKAIWQPCRTQQLVSPAHGFYESVWGDSQTPKIAKWITDETASECAAIKSVSFSTAYKSVVPKVPAFFVSLLHSAVLDGVSLLLTIWWYITMIISVVMTFFFQQAKIFFHKDCFLFKTNGLVMHLEYFSEHRFWTLSNHHKCPAFLYAQAKTRQAGGRLYLDACY